LELIRLLLCLAVTVLIGYSLLVIILHRSDALSVAERLSLSYGVGIGAAALQMFIYYFLNIPYTIINLLVFWAPVVAVGLLLPRRTAQPAGPKSRLSLFEKFLMGGIALEVILAFLRAFLKPLEAFDSVAMYAIRSKIIFASGMIPGDFFTNMTLRWPNPDYPLLLPLAQVWVYTFLGGLNDLAVKVLFPSYFLSFLAGFYFLLKRFVSRRESLIFTFILASIPQVNRFATNGYTDLILAYYYSIGVMLLLLGMKDKMIQRMVWGGLFLGFAAFTKNEGIALLAITAIVSIPYILIYLKRRGAKTMRQAVLSLAIAFIAISPWLWTRARYGLDNDVLKLHGALPERIIGIFGHLDRIPIIMYEFQKQFFGPKKWNIVWIIFFLLFLANIRKSFREETAYVSVSIIAMFILYSSIYLIIPVDGPINWFVATGVSRLLIHIVPLAVLLTALLCRERRLIEAP